MIQSENLRTFGTLSRSEEKPGVCWGGGAYTLYIPANTCMHMRMRTYVSGGAESMGPRSTATALPAAEEAVGELQVLTSAARFLMIETATS